MQTQRAKIVRLTKENEVLCQSAIKRYGKFWQHIKFTHMANKHDPNFTGELDPALDILIKFDEKRKSDSPKEDDADFDFDPYKLTE